MAVCLRPHHQEGYPKGWGRALPVRGSATQAQKMTSRCAQGMLTHPQFRLDVPSCFFGLGDVKLTRNKVAGRMNDIEYPANNPIEDRHFVQQLKSVEGYVAAVFDGHGGWQMVDSILLSPSLR